MEVSPAAALITPEADFVPEIVIIALDAPAQLGEVDAAAQRHTRVGGCGREFGGRVSPLGLSMSSVSSAN
jgi:hypothetical protein